MYLKPEQIQIPVAQAFISRLTAELRDPQDARDLENDHSSYKSLLSIYVGVKLTSFSKTLPD